MEPMSFERAVIAEAEARAAALGGDPTHTVAAVAVDAHGRVHHGVNVFHFTGGPCAELVVLGVAAAAGASPLLAIAAAGDRGRGLIAPCGRCRQAMLDLQPDLLVAVPTGDGPRMRTVAELLPDAYRHPDALGPRVLRFRRDYEEAVRTGAKRRTVRWNETVPVGPVLCVFEDDPAWPTLAGEVTAVVRRPLAALTPADVGLEPGADMAEYAVSLRGHYPGMPEDAVVDVVEFRVDPAR
jgi:cytidine deaminase